MRSARRFYRLTAALGVLGFGAAVLALGVAVRAIDFALPSGEAMLAACRRLVPESLDVRVVVVLSLGALGLLVLVRGGWSLLRQVHVTRRFVRRQTVLGAREVGEWRVELVASSRPQAFCAGLLHPRIYVSTGAWRSLSESELHAVIAHERHHRRRLDPVRMLAARVLSDALFFVPVMRRLDGRYGALAEVAADEAAIREKGAPALASALLTFGESKSPAAVVGIAPERVDHLLGRGVGWQLPISILLASLLAIAGLVTLALLGASLTGGGTMTLTELAIESCMVAMVAVPLLAAAGLLPALIRASAARLSFPGH